MYYTITISFTDSTETQTFKIDKDEHIKFIQFITTNIPNLQSYFVYRHTT